jgi:hypothetical protein
VTDVAFITDMKLHDRPTDIISGLFLSDKQACFDDLYQKRRSFKG